jgi:peptide/nickel transport system substrate-binding protein
MNLKIVLLMSLVLLLAACGGAAPTAEQQAAPATEEAKPVEEAAPATEEAKPAEAAAAADNIATYAYPGSFPDLDPSSSFSSENAVLSNVYETLTFFNPPGAKEALSPKLAVSWEPNATSTEWTFKLRKGVKFHDGTPFNAEAVKFSLERTKELGLGAAFILDPLDKIEPVDDLTVKFTLKFAAPLDLILSSGYAASMISPAAKDKDNKWFNEGNDAGTGPYMIETYNHDQNAILTQFKDYWGGWQEGQFTKVVFENYSDPTVAEQQIRSGEVDFTHTLPFENYEALAQAEGVVVDVTPSFQNLVGLLNNLKPPLDNPKVRQALSYSFPYDVVAKNLYAGKGTLAKGPVPADMWGHNHEIKGYTFDPDKAKALLAEAGVKEGEIKLVYTFLAGDKDEQQVGELWRSELAKIGVDLEVRGLAWEAQWDLAKTNPKEAQDIFVMYWWPTYITPYDFLYSMFRTEDPPNFNLGYYANPKFDALIDEANTISGVDREKATQMYAEAQQILVDDAASLYILDLPNVHVLRSDIKGYINNPAYSHVVFWYELRREAK